MYTERIEDYLPGKYHPVHLGDTYHHSRYKIIRKLGHGSFSTVWLARDSKAGRYVAVKIAHAGDSARDEKRIYDTLTKSKLRDHRGRQHYLPLVGDFKIAGPNGVHQCLLYEPMAGSVHDVQEQELGGKEFPLWMAKSILWQVLLGLDFLLDHGIVHGDVQPRNFLFTLGDLAHVPEAELAQRDFKRLVPRKTSTGNEALWVPQYLVPAESLMKYADITKRFTIKLTDLGGAFFTSNPPSKSTPPLALRSPEAIFQGRVTEKQDTWSFGCLIFQFITGRPLFYVTHFAGTSLCDDGHLMDMYQVLGFPDDEALRDSQWPGWRTYFDSTGKCIKNHIGEIPDGCDPNIILPFPPLEYQFDAALPEGFPSTEARVIKTLLRGLLQFDPEKRLSTKELLKHPWFAQRPLTETA